MQHGPDVSPEGLPASHPDTFHTHPTPCPRPAYTVLGARSTKPSMSRFLTEEERDEQRLADPSHRWLRSWLSQDLNPGLSDSKEYDAPFVFGCLCYIL